MKEKNENKFMEKETFRNIFTLIKWGFFSVIIGGIVGSAGTLFSYIMGKATEFRGQHLWLLLFLPLAGVCIVFLYRVTGSDKDRGTNLVLSAIHAETEIPFKMAPLIFISTILTHLFGASAGREGAALQLGGSLGNQLGRCFRMDEKDRRIVIMCGMSASFSAVFGTPIAAAIFSIEVASVGAMYYFALFPCVFSSLIAWKVAAICGVVESGYTIVDNVTFQLLPSIKIIFMAVCCAGVAILFCMALHRSASIQSEKIKNPYFRIIAASLLIIVATCILQTSDYMGTGVSVIERAVEGEARPEAFLLKILFTALALGAGFKGGEIVPSFFIGATFGCVFGHVLGISPSMCAAVGMVSVFCGVTNCPITSMLIAFELFGYREVPYFVIAVSVSYVVSGYYSLYHDQKIMYSKYKTEYIDRKTTE